MYIISCCTGFCFDCLVKFDKMMHTGNHHEINGDFFEGTEKLLEVWFFSKGVPDSDDNDLRNIERFVIRFHTLK